MYLVCSETRKQLIKQTSLIFDILCKDVSHLYWNWMSKSNFAVISRQYYRLNISDCLEAKLEAADTARCLLALASAVGSASTGGRLTPASLLGSVTDILTPFPPSLPPSSRSHECHSRSPHHTSLRHLLHSALSVTRRRESEQRMLQFTSSKESGQ